jgi:hypothetical protein
VAFEDVDRAIGAVEAKRTQANWYIHLNDEADQPMLPGMESTLPSFPDRRL